MQEQGQGWLRGAIIAGAIAAVVVYLVNRRGGATAHAQEAAGGAVETLSGAASGIGSTEIGRRGTRIVELLLGSVTEGAMKQVKALLKDALEQAESAVDRVFEQVESTVDRL